MIRVLRPGVWTSVQDAGRHGYQRFGVAVGGAADCFALGVANMLVGNDAKAAGLEMILAGPRLECTHETLIAWCGADFPATLDDRALPKDRPVRVPAGSALDFAMAIRGAAAWLAVGGGITVPEVMGSRSTDLVAKIGGVHGRRLAVDDLVPVGEGSAWTKAALGLLGGSTNATAWSLPPERLGRLAEPGFLRVMRGPEWEWFDAKAQELFFGESYEVTKESNRMGLRLAGRALSLTTRCEMISAAVQFGVVQVPPSGQPILLGADRQTLGGYPRIAVVATVDLGRLAQFRPGDFIRFREISRAEAHQLLLQREHDLALATTDLRRRVGLP